MTTTKKRTLTIICAKGEEVTKQQHCCFVHNLIADITRPKPLITWKRDPKAEIGSRAYYTNGLAAGTLITLRGLDDRPGVEFSYSRHGKQLYTAVETYDNTNITSDMHLATLLHKVICAVTMAEVAQKPNPLAETMKDLKDKYAKPAEELSITVRDVFNSIDVDMLVQEALDAPSMLSYAIAKNSPERARIETLIRATVSFIQNVRSKECSLLVHGIGLQSLPDKKYCSSLKSASLTQIANAYVKLPDHIYGGLNPDQRNLKCAKDIVVNLLAGV